MVQLLRREARRMVQHSRVLHAEANLSDEPVTGSWPMPTLPIMCPSFSDLCNILPTTRPSELHCTAHMSIISTYSSMLWSLRPHLLHGIPADGQLEDKSTVSDSTAVSTSWVSMQRNIRRHVPRSPALPQPQAWPPAVTPWPSSMQPGIRFCQSRAHMIPAVACTRAELGGHC